MRYIRNRIDILLTIDSTRIHIIVALLYRTILPQCTLILLFVVVAVAVAAAGHYCCSHQPNMMTRRIVNKDDTSCECGQ